MPLRDVLDNFAPPRGPPSTRLGAFSLVDAGEKAQRRRNKRREAVAVVKRSPEYLYSVLLDLDMDDPPDAEDITISKRAWEHAHRKWKHSVQSRVGAECGLSICAGS